MAEATSPIPAQASSLDAVSVAAVANLARASVKPERLDVPSLDAVFFDGMSESDSPLLRIAPDPLLRMHSLNDPVEIAAFAELHQIREAYYNLGGISLLLDDPNPLRFGRSVAFVRLNATLAFRKLLDWYKDRPWLSQEDLIKIFNYEFRGLIDPKFVEIFSIAKWELKANQDEMYRRDRQAMGLAVETSLAGGPEIAQDVTIVIPVFDCLAGRDRRYPVQCFVDIDTKTKRFQVTPWPGELARVEAQALSDIMKPFIDAKQWPAFYGAPKFTAATKDAVVK